MRLWRALRVVSGVRGALRSEGLEAAVRRTRPRAAAGQGPLPRERGRTQGAPRLGHRHRRHRQVAARLGVLQVHRRLTADHVLAPRPLPRLRRGRHLLGAGGHGPHALPASPRTRSRCPRSASSRRRSSEHLLDADERRFVEPRLAQLLGLADARGRRRQDLFAAWRLFFERLADEYPVVLAFEDLQWADTSSARLRRVPARMVAQPPAST